MEELESMNLLDELLNNNGYFAKFDDDEDDYDNDDYSDDDDFDDDDYDDDYDDDDFDDDDFDDDYDDDDDDWADVTVRFDGKQMRMYNEYMDEEDGFNYKVYSVSTFSARY